VSVSTGIKSLNSGYDLYSLAEQLPTNSELIVTLESKIKELIVQFSGDKDKLAALKDFKMYVSVLNYRRTTRDETFNVKHIQEIHACILRVYPINCSGQNSFAKLDSFQALKVFIMNVPFKDGPLKALDICHFVQTCKVNKVDTQACPTLLLAKKLFNEKKAKEEEEKAKEKADRNTLQSLEKELTTENPESLNELMKLIVESIRKNDKVTFDALKHIIARTISRGGSEGFLHALKKIIISFDEFIDVDAHNLPLIQEELLSRFNAEDPGAVKFFNDLLRQAAIRKDVPVLKLLKSILEQSLASPAISSAFKKLLVNHIPIALLKC
jgi:hypothetical protein